MGEGKPSPLYAVGITVVATLIAALAWVWIYPEARQLDAAYQRQAEERAEDYTRRAYITAANRCAHIATPSRAQCEEKVHEAARESQRREYDLQAQQSVANWTRAMGLAALIAMAIGIIGVSLVFVTFNATREANLIARRTAQRQLQAYLGIDDVYLHPKEGVWIIIKNFGQTPAFRVRMKTVHSKQPLWHRFEIVDPGHVAKGLIALKSAGIERLLEAQATFDVRMELIYTDIDGQGWERGARYRLRYKTGRQNERFPCYLVGGTAYHRKYREKS